jgi:hypothetical protein
MVKREGKENIIIFLSCVVLCACLKSENGCRKTTTKFAHWFVQNYHKRGTRRSFYKCPRKFIATLQFERQIKKEAIEEEDVDNQERSKPKHKKSKGQYTNWFQPHLWPPIMVVV